MPYDEHPELIEWDEPAPEDSRFIGFVPALALTALAGAAFGGGLFNYYGHNFCRPRSYHGFRDYYSCSPRYICRPAPY